MKAIGAFHLPKDDLERMTNIYELLAFAAERALYIENR